MLCSDDHLVADPELSTYNLDDKVDAFVDYIINMRKAYRTPNLLVPFGEDFNFQDAHQNFKNIEILFAAVKRKYGDQIEIKYSSLRRYLDAVHKTGVSLARNTRDFFPYADRSDAYWTGYFSSRPTSKRLIREASGLFRAISTLVATSASSPSDF